ncbi:MAG: winged helix-turn-helix domain-containing protein, partial [Thermomonas sp.]
EQALEPKAFAVLALLAGSPGQGFTRDEILDAVWGHRHVTPGVLNRVMTLLRHALGEEASAPHYLHTLHGIGYRFDLPAPTPAEVARKEVVPEATVVTPPNETSSLEPQPASSLLPPLRRANDHAPLPVAIPAKRRPWMIGAGVTALFATLVLGLLWLRRPDPALSASAYAASISAPVLIVLPLRSIGGNEEDRELAAGLSEELIGTLSRIAGLRVIARDSSDLAAAKSTDLSQLAQQLRVTHALQGSVRQDGEHLRISMRLLEAASGRLLWSKEFDRPSGDLFSLQDNIAGAVGSALQLQLQVGATPKAAAHEDPALYRRYLLAAGQITTNTTQSVVTDFRGLVTEHPDYARGWGGLATVLWLRSATLRPGRDALRAEAEHAAAKALALEPRQPDALAVLGGQACREQRWEDCLRLAREAVQQSPSTIQWRVFLARGLATTGYVDAALRELDEVLALDPLSPNHYLFRGRVLDTLGRHDEARKALLLANPMEAQTALYYNAAWRGDSVEMRRIGTALPMETPWRKTELAAADAIADPRLWPIVAALVPAEEQQLKAQGGPAYDFARFLMPVRDYERDIASLDQVQRQGYATYQWIFWQPESRGLRQHPAFQAYLKRSGLLTYWRKHGFPPQCRPAGDGALCE